jgi:hypothetical protein
MTTTPEPLRPVIVVTDEVQQLLCDTAPADPQFAALMQALLTHGRAATLAVPTDPSTGRQRRRVRRRHVA